jgi:WD40-like Beta Propeller Repeat
MWSTQGERRGRGGALLLPPRSRSPKGGRIAFTSDRDGDYEIYTIRTDGSDPRRLTHSPGNDAHNPWSHDGEWIVFTSARRGFKDESALHPFNPQPYGDLFVTETHPLLPGGWGGHSDKRVAEP